VRLGATVRRDELSAVRRKFFRSTVRSEASGFGTALDSLALTQAQIKQFAKHYRDWLQEGGNGTFFPVQQASSANQLGHFEAPSLGGKAARGVLLLTREF
jgi:hypothetical protein